MRAIALRDLIAIAITGGLLAMTGCGGEGYGGDGEVVADPAAQTPPVTPPATPAPASEPPAAPPAHKNLFTPVSNDLWDELAVRKVLHAFAYGGLASDGQINAWAEMAPEFAIEEMLTFSEHNTRLSPPALGDSDGLAARGGTLRELAAFWASNNPANGVTPENREDYDISRTSGSLPALWGRASVSRGLNPFRQKIGFWETNYHLAVTQAAVGRLALMNYYDNIMEAHEQGLPYQQVLAVAALSPAIVLQYGHHANRYVDGVCECNEDFAREYHQLFFGILGETAPAYHETVTIKNTAKAFTDMRVYFDDQTGENYWIDFDSVYHPAGQLEILGTLVGGTNASERITEMVETSINHPESLANLPVMIVRDLADDNLNPVKINAIRAAWAAMDQKNLLTFLRGYAISTIFHQSNRVKYLSSIDRHILLSNLSGLSNQEHYLDLYKPAYYAESVQAFAPTHDVFGTQTGLEAASSDLVFRKHYNSVTQGVWRYLRVNGTFYGQDWEKDWAAAIPPNSQGGYVVKDVAEWLWNHFLADGLKNFGPLERAHVYALLATDYDIAYLVDPINVGLISSVIATGNPAVVSLVTDLADDLIPLNSQVADERLSSNRRVGTAINFIIGTPYVFAQEGR